MSSDDLDLGPAATYTFLPSGTLSPTETECDDAEDAEDTPRGYPREPPRDPRGQRAPWAGRDDVRYGDDQEVSTSLAMAKAIDILGGMETAGACHVETKSVYGAVIALPQIARSARWPKTMLWLCLRCFLFAFTNYVIQTMFVYYIYDSQTNMNPFGGQMHLCDFASHVAKCPNAPDCVGPGGEEIPNPGVLYPYDIWNTRKFTRDALKAMFPERAEEIMSKFDPGEYGVESYYCRLICLFIFMLSIADEFQNIRDLGSLLYNLPSEALPWVQYKPPTWASKTHIKTIKGFSELEFVEFRVNGMPRSWKFFNILFLLLPKIFIWRMLTKAGVQFLMETAAMVDQIVNTTALSFVFTTDELILDRLTTKATHYMMDNLKEYEFFSQDPYEEESDRQALERYRQKEFTWCFFQRDSWLMPRRLVWSFVLTVLFLVEYYYHNCRKTSDGSLVSVDMFYPITPHLDIWCFIMKTFAYSCDVQEGAFWSMPKVPGEL